MKVGRQDNVLDIVDNHFSSHKNVYVFLSLAAAHLPVTQLNFAAVSQGTPFSRDIVGGCIRDTLQLLFRALAAEQNVFLTLQGIGVLYFKNNKVVCQLIQLYATGYCFLCTLMSSVI